MLNWSSLIKLAADVKPLSDLKTDSMDPGERALAGLVAVAGSASAKALPFLARPAINVYNKMTSSPWLGPPIQGAKTIDDAIEAAYERSVDIDAFEKAFEDANNYKKKAPERFSEHDVLGLFKVRREHPRSLTEELTRQLSPTGDPEKDLLDPKHSLFAKRFYETKEIADDFIQKNRLSEKGVRLNLQSGPLSSFGGGSYIRPTKEVFLPRMGREQVLHELGHAADFTTPIGRVRGMLSPVLQRSALVALPIALAAGDEIKRVLPGTVDDKAISFMQDHAPGIMAATLTATQLYPEAKASLLAIDHIRKLEQAGSSMAPKGSTSRAIRRLAPMFGSYLLGTIPAVVGMALAKKYMNEARQEAAEQMPEKTAGFVDSLVGTIDVGGQLVRQTIGLLGDKNALNRIGAAAKHIGTSPEFLYGSVASAVPATLGALYLYSTPSGEAMRQRLPQGIKERAMGSPQMAPEDERWREEHPLRFAGLVGAGAALSGGILSKFFSDLRKAL